VAKRLPVQLAAWRKPARRCDRRIELAQEITATIESLRQSIGGSVITPEDTEYDQARRVWNAHIDRRPAVIVQCASAQDVAAALGFAQAAGLEIAVRGGAHSFPGYSVCDDGLVVDLRRMNGVIIDPEAKRARVQGGALLADLDAAAQAHGLAVTAGIVGHTGVAGLTLGGGYGWLTRLAGLSIDNLLGAEVVVADGRILRASGDENSDLFWAIRGGGGNFGVVTEFEFRLLDVDPMVQFGFFFWGQDQARAALRLMRDVIPGLPRSLNALPVGALTAAPAPFVPVEHNFETGFALLLAGFGDPVEHQKAVDHIRVTEPPLFDFVTTMPYVALQGMFNEPAGWGFYNYEKGAYYEDINDEMIEILSTKGLEKESPLSAVFFARLDEAYCEVGEDDTAFSGGRSPRYSVNFAATCATPEQLPAEREWVRSLFEALRPHMLGAGAYVNILAEEEDARIRETYGAKYARLQMIKSQYDPNNVFRRNANIRPAVAVS
jgi:FAD/FMN-containing dehydrogenase